MPERCASMYYATGVSKSHCVTSCLPCKLPATPPIRGGAAACNRRLGDVSVDCIAPYTSILASSTLWILLHLYGVFGPNLLPMPLLANSSRKEKREESIWAACKTPQSLMPACLGGRKKMKWNARQLRRQGEQEGRLASCAVDGMCLLSLSPDIVSGP